MITLGKLPAVQPYTLKSHGHIVSIAEVIARTTDADGKVSDCAVTEGEYSPADRDAFCASQPDYDPLDETAADRSPRHMIIYWANYLRPRGS